LHREQSGMNRSCRSILFDSSDHTWGIHSSISRRNPSDCANNDEVEMVETEGIGWIKGAWSV